MQNDFWELHQLRVKERSAIANSVKKHTHKNVNWTREKKKKITKSYYTHKSKAYSMKPKVGKELRRERERKRMIMKENDYRYDKIVIKTKNRIIMKIIKGL